MSPSVYAVGGCLRMMTEVRFAYEHDNCWLLDTSRRYRAAKLTVTSPYQIEDVIRANVQLEAKGSEQRLAIEKSWVDDRRIHSIEILAQDAAQGQYHVSYTSRFSLHPTIMRHAPIFVGPIQVSNGEEHEHLIGESSNVRRLLRAIKEAGPLRIRFVRHFSELPPSEGAEGSDDVVRTLTQRQLDVLLSAHRKGYYEWPRELSAGDLAKELNVARPTLQRHLRAAEARVIGHFADQVASRSPPFVSDSTSDKKSSKRSR